MSYILFQEYYFIFKNVFESNLIFHLTFELLNFEWVTVDNGCLFWFLRVERSQNVFHQPLYIHIDQYKTLMSL